MITTKRKTKIIATLGPASSSERMIAALLEAGVDVFRLNFSHGTHEQKAELVKLVRSVSARLERAVGILADLQGPKIRTGSMEGGALPLVKGETLDIVTHDVLGRRGLISTVYTALPRDVKPGSRILLDDGLMELRVAAVEADRVRCTVVEGGILKDKKGMNLPGVDVSAPSLSEKDLEDLYFAIEHRLDYIALSFVRRASDVAELKRIIGERGAAIPVVAKIEKPEALDNFDQILAVADAVMVARGDLGVELQPERVPLAQKKIIRACNMAGKPVITATQMLESMITHVTPTRAETSDVANAILDGTDAVMLSGETASGAHPLEAVQTMVKVALEVEAHAELWRMPPTPERTGDNVAFAVAGAACQAAATLQADAIVVITQSGSSAEVVSQLRPQLPIIAFTPAHEVQGILSLWWGVRSQLLKQGEPVKIERRHNVKKDYEKMALMMDTVEETLLQNGFEKGDRIVVVLGIPLEQRGSTNTLQVRTIGADH